EPSSGAGRTPALVLRRRLDHRRLDVQPPLCEMLPRSVLDCPHLRLLGGPLLVERRERGLHPLGRLVVAGEHRGAEITQSAFATPVELEQLWPEPRQLPPGLGAD